MKMNIINNGSTQSINLNQQYLSQFKKDHDLKDDLKKLAWDIAQKNNIWSNRTEPLIKFKDEVLMDLKNLNPEATNDEFIEAYQNECKKESLVIIELN